MKVKLVFEKNFQEIRGLASNSFDKDINVDLPSGFDSARLVSARCYDPKSQSGSEYALPASDVTASIWEYEDEQRLVGKLLTYIDATYTDPEQRKAHKDIVKDLVYGYCQDMRTRATQIIDAHSK